MQNASIAAKYLFCVILLAFGTAGSEANSRDDKDGSTSFSKVITKDSYERITDGKTVFLKLFSPKCSHCQNLAPAWESMARQCMSQHEAENVLVGEIDCSTMDPQQNAWCDKNFHPSGLPTLLYGEPSLTGLHLKEYGGDRSISALTKFCSKIALQGPICTPSNLVACDKDTRNAYETYWTWSDEKMDEAIIDEEKNMEVLKKDYEAKFKELHDAYNKAALENARSVSALKTDIRILQELKEMLNSR